MRDPLAEALERAGYKRTSGGPMTIEHRDHWLADHLSVSYAQTRPTWLGNEWGDKRLPNCAPPPQRNRAAKILHDVACRHNLNPSDIKSASRMGHIVRARQEAMYRLRKRLRISYPQIAKIVGRQDHTTAVHGVRAHAKRHGLPVPTVRS